MYYANVKFGHTIVHREYDDIRKARKYIIGWIKNHPRSTYSPTICDGKRIIERISKGDSPMEYMTYDGIEWRYIREDGSITRPVHPNMS